MMPTVNRTSPGRRQNGSTLFRFQLEMEPPHPLSAKQNKKQNKIKRKKFKEILQQIYLGFLSPWAILLQGIHPNKFYAETLWFGIVSWRIIGPTHRILTFSARGVIIWMGKTIATFSLHLTRMTNFRCITRKCFVPNIVPRNSGAFQSNRWKPSSQEPNQCILSAPLVSESKLPAFRKMRSQWSFSKNGQFQNLCVDYF